MQPRLTKHYHRHLFGFQVLQVWLQFAYHKEKISFRLILEFLIYIVPTVFVDMEDDYLWKSICEFFLTFSSQSSNHFDICSFHVWVNVSSPSACLQDMQQILLMSFLEQTIFGLLLSSGRLLLASLSFRSECVHRDPFHKACWKYHECKAWVDSGKKPCVTTNSSWQKTSPSFRCSLKVFRDGLWCSVQFTNWTSKANCIYCLSGNGWHRDWACNYCFSCYFCIYMRSFCCTHWDNCTSHFWKQGYLLILGKSFGIWVNVRLKFLCQAVVLPNFLIQFLPVRLPTGWCCAMITKALWSLFWKSGCSFSCAYFWYMLY